jgi:hypothetical protein
MMELSRPGEYATLLGKIHAELRAANARCQSYETTWDHRERHCIAGPFRRRAERAEDPGADDEPCGHQRGRHASECARR